MGAEKAALHASCHGTGEQQVSAFRRGSLLGYSELQTCGISAHLFCCMHRIAVLYETSRRRAALAWVLHDLDVQVPWTVSDAWRSPIAGHEVKERLHHNTDMVL
jgi:hypothetical protein